ncbi:MAG: DNA repair protein RadC [Opitutaceae bacterium]|nr:DNA repair protein RadC [Opitutaceae bacterium]
MEGKQAFSLREVAPSERPQERLLRLGASALSDRELVALLLRSGTRGRDVFGVAHDLLAEAGSLARLATWNCTDFQRIQGVGTVKAVQLAAVAELGRRVSAQTLAQAQPVLDRPELAAAFLRPWTDGLTVEKFWVLCLNRKNRLIHRAEITSGIATSSLAHPREVFRVAVREGAVAVICAHNHPSGDPAPSSADIAVTRQLREASRALDITLLDHVILGTPAHDPLGRGHYSFREAGLL